MGTDLGNDGGPTLGDLFGTQTLPDVLIQDAQGLADRHTPVNVIH